jgi:hypothetical protein
VRADAKGLIYNHIKINLNNEELYLKNKQCALK